MKSFYRMLANWSAKRLYALVKYRLELIPSAFYTIHYFINNFIFIGQNSLFYFSLVYAFLLANTFISPYV